MCASVFARAKTDTHCPHWKDPRYLRGAYIMNHKKLLLTLTLCLCMLLGAVSLASAEEDGATGSGAETGGNTGHSHALCYGTTTCTDPAHSEENHGSVTFEKAITMADNVLCIDGVKQTPNSNSSDNYEYTLSEGTYYLDDNLTLNKGIQVQGNVTLCLNGHEIRSEGFYVIQTPWSGTVTFTLCDCKARGKIAHTVNSSSNSAGVNFNNTSTSQQTFIMYNGCITQNKGSGVYLYQNTSFTMYGGSITQNGYNNTSQWGVSGGGVCVHSEATFTMYGGTITENYGDYGGGVYVAGASGETYGAGNFTMSGGTITKNHAGKIGGGIYSNSNNISIYGGSVTDNSVTKNGKAGGIYVSSSDTLTVGGNVNISGNWKGEKNGSISNNNANNVYLPANSTITIEKALTGKNSSIGVTTATPVATTKDASVKIAAGKGTYAITDEDKGHFTPDTGYCEVQKKNDGIYLTHVHSGGTATCTAKAKCGGCNAPYGDALGHDFVHHDAQPATCTAKGLEAYDTCSRCDYSTTKVEIPMADHTYSATEWKSDVDNHWHECSVCHTQIGKAAHEWQPATYTAPKTCVCGATTGTKLSAYYYYSPAKTEDTPGSPKAGDPGVLLYAGLTLASLAGLACTAKKRH